MGLDELSDDEIDIYVYKVNGLSMPWT